MQQRIEQQLRRATDTYAQVVALLGQVETVAAETGQSIPQPLRPRGIEQRTLSGAAALTSREREVLAHLSTGATNVQIARNLVVSEATVKSHLKQISRKLGTSSRAAAVAAYARMTQGNLGFAP
ncbi:response regulator transcription factor [Nocardia jiangxiensis]|uniref:response regulator transcription factor n=1 Tax=Nocardia jiangxiensis TaxID=282685 RepID=UPI000689080A|nr:helix-turn-helix transcriptional regulator [Nocardia jiangxiensis]